MGCIPESGGCERHKTDPFVNYYNQLFNTNFEHDSCLDVFIKDRPQPEVLCIDSKTFDRIVIERKTFVWPLDYAKQHKADHYLGDILLDRLKNITQNKPYALSLGRLSPINRHKLENFAQEIVETIKLKINDVDSGIYIGSNEHGRQWRFYLENDFDRDEDMPSKGLIIYWNTIYHTELLIPENIPVKLKNKINKTFNSCEKKFSEYMNDRRILLIDQYGDLRYKNRDWWIRVFRIIEPPEQISEIWLAIFDWITDREEGWIFEKLYPDF